MDMDLVSLRGTGPRQSRTSDCMYTQSSVCFPFTHAAADISLTQKAEMLSLLPLRLSRGSEWFEYQKLVPVAHSKTHPSVSHHSKLSLCQNTALPLFTHTPT